jgi:opine dehydrogenase
MLLAGIPVRSGRILADAIGDVWPFAEIASSIWDTILLNFDAIDVVPVAVSNAATLEVRPGGMLLWAEGASQGVVRLIERLDGELLAIRTALGTKDTRRYCDYLMAQGLAPAGTSLYEVLRSSAMMRGIRASGASQDLCALLDVAVPFSLVFAASIAKAVEVPAPVIGALVEVAGTLVHRDFTVEGRTLAGLGLAGLDAAGLRLLATEGHFS